MEYHIGNLQTGLKNRWLVLILWLRHFVYPSPNFYSGQRLQNLALDAIQFRNNAICLNSKISCKAAMIVLHFPKFAVRCPISEKRDFFGPLRKFRRENTWDLSAATVTPRQKSIIHWDLGCSLNISTHRRRSGERMTSTEGRLVPNGVRYGVWCPLPSRLWRLEKRRELPRAAGSEAEPGRKLILAYFEGHRTLHFVPILQNMRWQFALASPTPNYGGLVPPAPVIYAHASTHTFCLP